MEITLAGIRIDNRVNESYINGDYIGGNQYKYYLSSSHLSNPFNENIFLHYNGNKISKLLFLHNIQNRIISIRNTNKLSFALFNNIYISLSDLIQSPFIYDEIFKQVLSFKEEPLITIVGTKVNQDITDFFYERDRFYFKTGFYEKISGENQEISDLIINYNNIVQKHFNTKTLISHDWKENLSSYNGNIKSIGNIFLKNAVINISDSINSEIDKLISIPDHLDGMPFIWDSIKYLSLTPKYMSELAQYNMELYLASQWIRAYIENLSCNIFNAIIGCNDSRLGIEDYFDLKSLIIFLKQYKLLDYLLELTFEELIHFRFSNERCVLQNLLGEFMNNSLMINNLSEVHLKICKIYTSDAKALQKLQKAIWLLFENARCISFYG